MTLENLQLSLLLVVLLELLVPLVVEKGLRRQRLVIVVVVLPVVVELAVLGLEVEVGRVGESTGSKLGV